MSDRVIDRDPSLDEVDASPQPWVKRPRPAGYTRVGDWWRDGICSCGNTAFGITAEHFASMPALFFGSREELVDSLNDGFPGYQACDSCGAILPPARIDRLYIPPVGER